MGKENRFLLFVDGVEEIIIHLNVEQNRHLNGNQTYVRSVGTGHPKTICQTPKIEIGAEMDVGAVSLVETVAANSVIRYPREE